MSSLRSSLRHAASRLSSFVSGSRLGIAVGMALVLVPILALLPYLRSMISRNAVVAAFVHTARAPISGTLAQAPPAMGAVVSNGAESAWIEDPRVDDGLVSELASRRQAQQEMVAQLEAEEKRLAALETRHAETERGYRDALTHDVELREAGLKREIEGSEARLVELGNDAARAKSLAADGVISPAELETATAALEALEAERDAQQALLGRLVSARRELGSDRFMSEGLEGAIEVGSQLQAMRLELLRLDRERAAARAELEALSARLERAEDRLGRVHRAAVEVPDGVVVWQVNALPGQFVEAGQPVFSFVDCSALYLDMRLDDSVLSLVEVGQKVHFRLFGTRQWHQAEVALVRGSGAVIEGGSLATEVARATRDGQVLSRIEPDATFGSGAAFCGIGRKAFAELHGVGLYDEFLRRLFL